MQLCNLGVIDLYLEFENASLLFMENERILPFAMLSTHLTKIDFHRENTKRITIEVTAKTVNASYFHLFEDENKLIERKLLGQLEEVNEYIVDDSLISNIIENIQLKTDSIKNSLVNEIDENFRGVYLNIFVDITAKKDKVLKITIKNMQLYLMFARYLKLLDILMLDSSTDVPLPKYWKQMKGIIFINIISFIISLFNRQICRLLRQCWKARWVVYRIC